MGGCSGRVGNAGRPERRGVREAEPAVGVPLEREFGAFGDVEVRRHRFPPGEGELSAEVTEAEGNVMAVPAGVPAWQALFDASEAVNMLLDEDLVSRLAEEAGGDASRVEVLGGLSGHPSVGLAEFLPRYPESHRHLART